jgi:hypothetical protein
MRAGTASFTNRAPDSAVVADDPPNPAAHAAPFGAPGRDDRR